MRSTSVFGTATTWAPQDMSACLFFPKSPKARLVVMVEIGESAGLSFSTFFFFCCTFLGGPLQHYALFMRKKMSISIVKVYCVVDVYCTQDLQVFPQIILSKIYYLSYTLLSNVNTLPHIMNRNLKINLHKSVRQLEIWIRTV